jgi:hypothetical protein
MSFESATPFQNQKELTEQERFYMNGLVEQGFQVRYDEKRIYNKSTTIFSILRANLVIGADRQQWESHKSRSDD